MTTDVAAIGPVHALEQGSVVSLICYSGEPYLDRYYSDVWLVSAGIAASPYRESVLNFLETGCAGVLSD